MPDNERESISQILSTRQAELLERWLQLLSQSGVRRDDLMREAELRTQCQEVLSLLREAVSQADAERMAGPQWDRLRDLMADISRSRALQGFTPTQTATFVLSLKEPLFEELGRAWGADAQGLVRDVWTATRVLDALAIYSTEAFMRTREEVISRQQEEMLELSTPVVKLWDGILALPMIGTLDSARTQVVMENLLQKIVETGAEVAIIDITGVPTVDTLTAQHLLKTVTAARLMGADCIISGIRPQIAQTIVHLGVELNEVVTKATLADAFVLALKRTGGSVVRAASKG
jgi:rsbT co-antagonist protein RsbR